MRGWRVCVGGVIKIDFQWDLLVKDTSSGTQVHPRMPISHPVIVNSFLMGSAYLRTVDFNCKVIELNVWQTVVRASAKIFDPTDIQFCLPRD